MTEPRWTFETGSAYDRLRAAIDRFAVEEPFGCGKTIPVPYIDPRYGLVMRARYDVTEDVTADFLVPVHFIKLDRRTDDRP